MIKHFFKGNDINSLYIELIDSLSTESEYSTSPRGQKIKENVGVQVRLTDPTQCLLTIKERKINYAFAVIEKLEYLSGQTSPERLLFYNKNLDFCRNEYGTFDGAYMDRISYWFRHIYEILKSDSDSRQAVISIYGIQDRHKSADIPCTTTLQFLIRDGKLNLIATMRSNDVLWGFPYDTNGFCFLQEAMAALLNIEIGTYILNAGSLHIYEEREKQLTSLLDGYEILDIHNPKITHCSFDELISNLDMFWFIEKKLRTESAYAAQEFVKYLPDWLKEYYQIILKYNENKNSNRLG